jgi:hypothetical protein
MDSALISTLVNLGAGGIVVVLLAFGILVPKPSVDKMERQYREYIERQEAAIARLQTALDYERTANDALRNAGGVTNQLISALVDVTAQQPPGRGTG